MSRCPVSPSREYRSERVLLRLLEVAEAVVVLPLLASAAVPVSQVRPQD